MEPNYWDMAQPVMASPQSQMLDAWPRLPQPTQHDQRLPQDEHRGPLNINVRNNMRPNYGMQPRSKEIIQGRARSPPSAPSRHDIIGRG